MFAKGKLLEYNTNVELAVQRGSDSEIVEDAQINVPFAKVPLTKYPLAHCEPSNEL